MNRNAFLQFLKESGCSIEHRNPGYAVCRNVVNGKMSGVPIADPVYPATACRICKTLGIDPPDEVQVAVEIIDIAHRRHGNG
jgi:hypothetical protein